MSDRPTISEEGLSQAEEMLLFGLATGLWLDERRASESEAALALMERGLADVVAFESGQFIKLTLCGESLLASLVAKAPRGAEEWMNTIRNFDPT